MISPREQPRLRDWIGFMSMVVGMFMAILDIQIVSSSIAEIQAGLAASPDEAAWVQTSYLIAEIVMLPLSGWLSRALSTRVLYVGSALGFTLASALCASAHSLGEMILWRALQGFIGGAMIPTVFATAFLMFPPRYRLRVQVLVSLCATLAPTIGPTLGGWLTDSFSWHWVFLVNLVPGVAVAGAVWALMDIDRPDLALLRRLDWIGLVSMAAFLGSLEYVLEEGNRWDWFDDPDIRRFALLSAAGCAVFLWRMLTAEDPLVDLRPLGDRNFLMCYLLMGVIGVGLYGAVYIVPLFFAEVRGFNSYQIGVAMLATGAVQFFTGPISGRVAAHVDMRYMATFGLICFALSCWWMASLTNLSGTWEIVGPQGLRGFALMFLFVPVNQLCFGTLPPHMLKNAAGLFNTMRNLGGAIGIALLGTLLTNRTQFHWLHLAEQVTWSRPSVPGQIAQMTRLLEQKMGPMGAQAVLPELAKLVEREALVQAFNDVLLAMALCFVVAIPLSLLLRRPGPSPSQREAARGEAPREPAH